MALRTRSSILALIGILLFGPALDVQASAPAPDRGYVAPARVAGAAGGFTESIVLSGLTYPTVVRFSPDGRVFVAEKSGIIKVFSSLTATTPTVFADLTTQVYSFWDRGLLGMALHPNFPTTPYIYVLYSHDANIGGVAPKFGTPGVESDPCPTPPGANADGCVISGRLSRLTASGNAMTGAEQVLLEDWCQQYPSHSIGSVEFGPDGALYVSGGEGANFNVVDYGQLGDAKNPCGDPPVPVGGTQNPPNAQGGALRSQDIRTSRNPVTLDGKILRIDPNTGAGMPDNAFSGSSDPNKRRTIAYGLRNPLRFGFRPGTNEVWVGDVGWGDWEEINRIPNPKAAALNFGWPCYEGEGRQSAYESAGLTICQQLYNQPSLVTAPFYKYFHGSPAVPNDTCTIAQSTSITGLTFYNPANGGNYPAAYNNAMFFGDYSRNCIWVMYADTNGFPLTDSVAVFQKDAAAPVNITTGPNGDVFYVDHLGGTIRRISYSDGNLPPSAKAVANKTSGPLPLTVNFDGSGSDDPDPGDSIAYSWDLNGDGNFGDSTLIKPTFTYTVAGTYLVKLRVSDSHGATAIANITITAGNTAPTAFIDSPAANLTWKVGDVISYSGHGTDPEDPGGVEPGSRLTWTLTMEHCPGGASCHTHVVGSFTGLSGTFVAPDHEYPSYLRLRLDVTDAGGLTTSVSRDIKPQIAVLDIRTAPAGMNVAVNAFSGAAPYTQTVIAGSTSSLSAVDALPISGQVYQFASWTDGKTRAHTVDAVGTTVLTATYSAANSVTPWKVLYDDALPDALANWSWNGSIDFANNTPLFAGTHSLKYTPTDPWGAVRINTPDSSITMDTSPYDTLRFALRATAAGAVMQIIVYDDQDQPTAPPILLASFGGDPIAGAWRSYAIPLTALNIVNRKITGIAIQEVSGNTQPPIYLDEYGFSGPSTPGGRTLYIPATVYDSSGW